MVMTFVRHLSWSLAVTVLVSLSTPAFAHNVVEELTPAPGAVVSQSPLAISVSTDAMLLDLGGDAAGFGIVIRDASGLYYGDGCVIVSERTMSARADLGEAGTYSIVYQFVSADGHSLSETYDVTFSPTGYHTPAAGFDTPAQCGVPSDQSAEPAETGMEAVAISGEAETPASSEPARDPLLIIGFLSLVSVAVVVWIVWRVRQKRDSS
jgi:copper resistance protein C